MLDLKDPLIVLADNIQWEIFDENFEKYYSKKGRPVKPIRVMVGLLLLKQIENLSDETSQTISKNFSLSVDSKVYDENLHLLF